MASRLFSTRSLAIFSIAATVLALGVLSSSAAAKPKFAKHYKGTVTHSYVQTGPDGYSRHQVYTVNNLRLKLKKVGFQGDLNLISNVKLASYKVVSGTLDWSVAETGSCSYSTSGSVNIMSALLPVGKKTHVVELEQPGSVGPWFFNGLIPVSQDFSYSETCLSDGNPPMTNEINDKIAGDIFHVRGVKAKPGKKLRKTISTGTAAGGKLVQTWSLKPY
jgi:hypothetical protein